MNNAAKNKLCPIITLLVLAVMLSPLNSLYAGSPPAEKNKDGLNKTATNDVYQSFTINNLFNYYSNNGDGSYNVFHASSGLEFPKGSGNTVVFEDGFLFGGITRTSPTDPTRIVKVGGSGYRHGLQAGRIITQGTASTLPIASNPSDAGNRIFKVRPDINPTVVLNQTLEKKIQSEELNYTAQNESGASIQKIYDQYILDWNEWPASQGAPFKDNNGNGTYEPVVDIPGVPGADQTLWHVSNDLDATKTKFLYGSDPIGLELQRTIWGHKRSGPFGNMIFTKYKVINKSGADIDSMYMTQWADSDLGGAGDDFSGCDTVLGLGYMYNGKANDEQYGIQVPAVGYDFFQGPIVPGAITDSAIFDGKIKMGFKNLPMTSFNFFIGGNILYTEQTQGSIQGTIQWYRSMKGLISSNGAPYINPTTGKVTTYILSGDPVAGSGWIDGTIAPPGDRKFALSSGPFTMVNGDTQEVVTAVIVGQGADRVTSISVLKFSDKYAQAAYNSNFDIPSAPSAPVVTVVNADGTILLDWGNEASAKLTESQDKNGYKFQGYNIYQSKTSSYSPENSIRLATFDIDDNIGVIRDEIFDPITSETVVRNVQFGTNSGMQRFYKITTDAFTKTPLVNGRPYYFFVTAYNFNSSSSAVPNNFESAPQLVEVIPQSTTPGVRNGKRIDDMLTVTHSAGVSEGTVAAMVIAPERLTGHDYSVSYDTIGGTTYWKLTDITLNTVLLDSQAQHLDRIYNWIYKIGYNDGYTVDGFLVKVIGVLTPGMKEGVQGSAISDSPDLGFHIVKGVRAFTWAGGGSPFVASGMEGFGGGMGGGFQFNHALGGALSTITASDIGDVLIEFAGTDAVGKPVNAASDTVSLAYRYVLNGQNAAADPSFAPFLPPNTPAPVGGSWGYIDRRAIPMRVYEWNSATQTKGQRLNIGFLENNIAKAAPTGGRVDGLYWPPTNAEVTTYVAATNPKEWLFIFRSTYDAATPDPKLTVNLFDTPTPMLYWWTVARNGQPWAGNVYSLESYKSSTPADVFTFTTPAPMYTVTAAQADVEKINVYPNPYFRYNSQESSLYYHFITFNHLPQKATIRIFTLAGILVKTIHKDDDSQFIRWNMRNESGYASAAGIYIVHIEMPEIGKTKIVKLAIIPATQYIDQLPPERKP